MYYMADFGFRPVRQEVLDAYRNNLRYGPDRDVMAMTSLSRRLDSFNNPKYNKNRGTMRKSTISPRDNRKVDQVRQQLMSLRGDRNQVPMNRPPLNPNKSYQQTPLKPVSSPPPIRQNIAPPPAQIPNPIAPPPTPPKQAPVKNVLNQPVKNVSRNQPSKGGTSSAKLNPFANKWARRGLGALAVGGLGLGLINSFRNRNRQQQEYY